MMDDPLRFSTLRIKFNALRDELTIEGVTYAAQLFREFDELLPEGAKFKLVRRFKDDAGQVRIELERIAD